MNALFLLLAASQGSILSLAFLSGIIRSDYFRFFLGLIFLVVSVEIWTYWSIKQGYLQNPLYFPFWNLGSYLFLPPALNYILQRQSKEKLQPTKLDFLLLIPGGLEILINVVGHYFRDLPMADFFSNQNSFWVIYTQIAPLVWLAFVLARNFKWRGATKKYILVHGYFMLIFILWLVDYVFPHQIFIYVEIVLIITLFVMGYLAYLKPLWFNPPVRSVLDTMYGDYDHKKHSEVFEKHIQSESVYSSPELTLEQVAKGIDVSPKYLSYLVNKYHHMNFKSYLNKLRIKKVMEDINAQKHEKQTLLSIALDAGFNSKSSFNASFKKQTGLTPSEYLKKIKES